MFVLRLSPGSHLAVIAVSSLVILAVSPHHCPCRCCCRKPPWHHCRHPCRYYCQRLHYCPPAGVPLQSLPASLPLLLPATSLLSPGRVPLQSLPEYGSCLYSKFHCCHSLETPSLSLPEFQLLSLPQDKFSEMNQFPERDSSNSPMKSPSVPLINPSRCEKSSAPKTSFH